MDESIDSRIAQRLRALRTERGLSLDELSARSDVSRATLSRIENQEVSPTASVLGKLCPVFGLTLSRLILMAEENFTPIVRRENQMEWQDPETGFRRRAVSPPASSLVGEVLECELPPGAKLAYEKPPRPGLEHHLVLLTGELRLTVDGRAHDLKRGDCLRYQLQGATLFETPTRFGAKYLLFLA